MRRSFVLATASDLVLAYGTQVGRLRWRVCLATHGSYYGPGGREWRCLTRPLAYCWAWWVLQRYQRLHEWATFVVSEQR